MGWYFLLQKKNLYILDKFLSSTKVCLYWVSDKQANSDKSQKLQTNTNLLFCTHTWT